MHEPCGGGRGQGLHDEHAHALVIRTDCPLANVSAVPETVVLRQFAHLDFEEDLDAIADAAREAGRDFEITVQRVDSSDPHVRGATGRSILEVVASGAGSYAFGKVADAIIAKARSSWKARHKPNHWPRTHIVKILGPDGEVLREVKVSDDPPTQPAPLSEHPPPGASAEKSG